MIDFDLKLPPNKLLIGINGVAGSGKDSIAQMLEDKLHFKYKIQTASLAEKLREELKDVVQKNFLINVFTEDRCHKNLIRPILVEWARVHRKQSHGLYFIIHLKHKLNKLFKENDIVVVSDCRYKEYPFDELDFFKLNGFLIHVSKIINVYGAEKILEGANSDEQINDPLFEKEANYKIVWPEANRSILEKKVDHLINWLNKNNYLPPKR